MTPSPCTWTREAVDAEAPATIRASRLWFDEECPETLRSAGDTWAVRPSPASANVIVLTD